MARSSWCGARCAPPTSSTHPWGWTSASARTGSTPSRSADQLHLLERRAPVLDLQLGLVDDGTRNEVGGRAVGGLAVVVTGVFLVPLVVALLVLVLFIVAGLFALLLVAGAFLVVIGVGGRCPVFLAAALDLGFFRDQAAHGFAAEDVDHQLPRGRVEGGDRAGILLAVGDPVVVAVGVAGVGPGHELGAVAQAVAVLVAAGLVDPDRESMALLPAIGDAVVVAVALLGGGDARHRQHGQQADRDEQEPEAVTAFHRSSLRLRFLHGEHGGAVRITLVIGARRTSCSVVAQIWTAVRARAVAGGGFVVAYVCRGGRAVSGPGAVASTSVASGARQAIYRTARVGALAPAGRATALAS